MTSTTVSTSLARLTIQLLALVMICASLSLAQSGRKQKKTEAQPPIQGVNQPDARVAPEPTAEAPPHPKVPGLSVLVASDTPDITLSTNFTNTARQACIAEIQASHSVDVQEARDQNRVDAIKKAKEGEVFVVLLELRQDGMASSSNGRLSFNLNFTIFEPKTGKVVTSGSGYPTSDSRSQNPPISYDYDLRQVELMGRDAGRKALKAIIERAPKSPVNADTTP
jgi:hypothetical protein